MQIRKHHEVQHQWTPAQLTTAVGIKEKAKERKAIRKEKTCIKVKDTTAPRPTKEKEKEDIPSVKGIHFNKEIHSKEHQKGKESTPPNTMKGTRKSKGKDTCYKCGQQGRVAVYNVSSDEHQQ
jgi:hypothetical protein